MNGPRLVRRVLGGCAAAAIFCCGARDAAAATSEPPVTIDDGDTAATTSTATTTTSTSTSTTTTSTTSTTVVASAAADITVSDVSTDAAHETQAEEEAAEVEVEAEADAPCVWSAADDYYTGVAGGPIFVGSSTWWGSNDHACASTYITHTQPAHGTVDIDYPAQYTPDPGFTGLDSFVYSYEMPMGTVHASATVYITVTDCEMAASADNIYDTDVDTPLAVDAPGILANDTLGCPSFTVDADPAQHGTIDVDDDGSFLYTPDAGYMGVEKIEYRLVDSADNVLAAATIRLEVNGPPCVAADDSYSVHSGDGLHVGAPGVLVNDVVCPQFESTGTGGFNSPPQHGTVTMNGDGSFTYLPDSGYVGPDSFGYAIYYGNLDSSSATVDIDVVPPCATALVDDAYTVGTSSVLHVGAPGPGANDTLCDGDELTVADGPDHGGLTLLSGGDMTYEPDPGFVGIDTFTYTVAEPPSGFFGRARPAPLALRPGAVPPLTATVTITVAEGASTTSSTTVSTPSTTTPSIPGTLPATGATNEGVIVAFAVALMLTGTCVLLAIRRPRPR